MQKIDLTGKPFGMLTVTREADTSGFWWVRCQCGSPERVVKGASLRSGNTQSCGCLRTKTGTRRVRSPRKYAKPHTFISMDTFGAQHADAIRSMSKALKDFGVKFDTTTMMYITQHDGKAYGPFKNPCEMLGHIMIYGVGVPDKPNIRKLEKWREQRAAALGEK